MFNWLVVASALRQQEQPRRQWQEAKWKRSASSSSNYTACRVVAAQSVGLIGNGNIWN